MPNRQGQQIDNYRLIRLLGTGQFGQVYLAEHTDPQIQTQVAIKVLDPLARDDQRDLLKFLKEVRASRLKHNNIVQVYDFGIQEDIPFIVMEYAPNGTLGQRHPRGKCVPLSTIVPYVRQVADALQYIHEKRFIHRDVKPANMLIGAEGQILLSDFGVATNAHGTFSQCQEDLAGTILYIAPEQLTGQPRPASDQYSLAIVVYEWLCGTSPFQGGAVELMVKHQTMSPPLLSARLPTISSDVEQVVMRALSKDHKQRFDCILDFAHALEHASLSVVGERTTISLPDLAPMPDSEFATEKMLEFAKPWISRRRALVVGGVGATSLLAAGGGFLWLEQRVYAGPGTSPSQHTEILHPTPTPTPTPLPLGMVLTTYKGHTGYVKAVTWSPDSKRIASGSDDNTVQVWDAIGGGHVFPYKDHTSSVEAVAWAPIGQRIASAGFDNTVQVWDASDGSHVFPYKGHANDVDAVAWSPNGKYIASGSYDWTVQVWNAIDGGSPYTYKGHHDIVRKVTWSPNNDRIASASFDGTVQVWNALDGGSPYTYQGHAPAPVEAVAWSPDGGHIASCGNDGTVQVWDATRHNLVVHYTGHSGPVNAVAWSPDGGRVASGGVDGTVQIWDVPNGDLLYTFSRHSAEVNTVAWSLDGRLIASGGDDNTVYVWGTG